MQLIIAFAPYFIYYNHIIGPFQRLSCLDIIKQVFLHYIMGIYMVASRLEHIHTVSGIDISIPVSPFVRPPDFQRDNSTFLLQIRFWLPSMWHIYIDGDLNPESIGTYIEWFQQACSECVISPLNSLNCIIDRDSFDRILNGFGQEALAAVKNIHYWIIGETADTTKFTQMDTAEITYKSTWHEACKDILDSVGPVSSFLEYTEMYSSADFQTAIQRLNEFIVNPGPIKISQYSSDSYLLPLYKTIRHQYSESAELRESHHSVEKDLERINNVHKLRAEIWKIAADKNLSTDALIKKMLFRIGPFLKVSRACYNSFADVEKQGGLICAIEWCDRGVKPSLGTHIPQFLVKQMINKDAFHITPESASNLVPGPVKGLVRRMIEAITIPLNVKSLSLLPHHIDGEIEGLFTFDICRSNPHHLDMTPKTREVISEMVDIVNNHILQRRVQSELKKAYDEMEIRVEARTADLARMNKDLQYEIKERIHTEKKLRTAKEAAEAANIVKSQFLANVSHEIRTPLHAVIGFAEIILRLNSLPDIQQKTRIILSEADSLLKLIEDLLDQAKMESGKMHLNSRPFDLHLLLDHIKSSQGGLAEKKGLMFNLKIKDDVPRYIVADELRIRQILVNLVHNAVKFTSSGEINVNVSLRNCEDERIWINMEVADSGMGIPFDKITDIFKSFTQVDGSATRQFGGTGLGTTIAKQLVELMGGHIGVESHLGKGSSFWFYIPVLAATVEETELSDSSFTLLEMVQTKKGARLLLVEDYIANQEVALMCLEETGYTIDVANNGAEALKLCEQYKYDLILMDVQMPIMDGHTATRKLREGKGMNRDVNIVGITAHASARDKQACLDAGMNDVLTKPLHHDEMLGKVYEWIGIDNSTMSIKSSKLIASHPAGEVPLDVAILNDEFGVSGDWRPTISRFLAHANTQIDRMQDAVNREDWDDLRRESHALKGGAATLTAEPLRSVAEQLEQSAAGSDVNHKLLLNAIQEQLDIIAAFLKEQNSNSK
ncbi:response regulator [bacterium]|nr:response regulator [bacterium]